MAKPAFFPENRLSEGSVDIDPQSRVARSRLLAEF